MARLALALCHAKVIKGQDTEKEHPQSKALIWFMKLVYTLCRFREVSWHFWSVRILEKKTFEPCMSHLWEDETVHGKKLNFYIPVGNMSPTNLSKILLTSMQRLWRYKWVKFAIQSFKLASTIKTFSTIVLHVITKTVAVQWRSGYEFASSRGRPVLILVCTIWLKPWTSFLCGIA